MTAPGLGEPSDPEVVLQVEGLRVEYGRGPSALRAVLDVDLSLHRGEVLGLAGESGSGKSTLAYGMTRLLRAPGVITGGRVVFYPGPDKPGVDLLEAPVEQLRRLRWREIAVVFQSAMHALNPVISVEAQLTDTLAAHLPRSRPEERRERAKELLQMVGISADRLRSFPHELSGGMRQRVMIAMALALEPKIVIMDEPTTALDVVTQRKIIEEVVQLRDRLGFSVIFITHDLSLLLEMADTIAVMYAGRIVERASARQLLGAPRHPYSAGLLNSFPSLHGDIAKLTGIPGSPPDLAALPTGCAFRPRCNYVVEECQREVPPLVAPLGSAPGDREVACWLHCPGHRPPPELALADDVAQPDRVAGEAVRN